MTRTEHQQPHSTQGRALLATIYLLAALFIVAGGTKLAGLGMMEESFAGWGLPSWMMLTVGAGELLGGVLLLGRGTTWLGAVALSLIMSGAIITHVVNGETPVALIPLALLSALGYVFHETAPRRTAWDGRVRSLARHESPAES